MIDWPSFGYGAATLMASGYVGSQSARIVGWSRRTALPRARAALERRDKLKQTIVEQNERVATAEARTKAMEQLVSDLLDAQQAMQEQNKKSLAELQRARAHPGLRLETPRYETVYTFGSPVTQTFWTRR